jgi:hypothetical protein
MKKLTSHTSVPPRLYGLNKEDVPFRPIVNCTGSPTYGLPKYLAGLLCPLVGQSEHHITDKIQNISLQKTDILVSFDVVSLFTKVPVEDMLQLLSQHFNNQTTGLITQVLTTYFL